MEKIENIVILAAGKSRRFWPLTDKNLFKFLGKEVVFYQIKKFLPYAKNLFVVVNQNNLFQIKKIGEGFNSRNIFFVIQKGEGQGGALLSLEKLVKGETLVLNNVDFFNEKRIFPSFFKNRNHYHLILTGKKIKNYFPGGYFKLNKEKVVGLIEKPGPTKMPSLVYKLVCDYFANFSHFLSYLKKVKNNRDDVYELALDNYLKETRAKLIIYDDFWLTLKYPWQVLEVGKYFLGLLKKKISGRNVFIDKTAIIEGKVFLGEGVKVYQYTKIVGPCYIGKNTVVGNYSLIRESMIGDDCLIGGYSEVTRSYLGDKVYLHRNYIGDSVIENNVLFGAGAVCANFRFDEKEIYSKVKKELINTGRKKLGAIIGSNVKIGVNASLMPGVKITGGSFIMPSSFVNKDYH